MTENTPSIYLLYGNDKFAMTEFVQSMKKKLGDKTTTEMNFLMFTASDLDWSELGAAASSMPFLAARRLIVLDEAERFQKDSKGLDRLFPLLEQLPPTTALVLLERTIPTRGARNKKASKLRQWVQEHASLSYMRACDAPHGPGFVTWLQKRAAAEGGSIEREAAELLAEWIQEDPRLASQELIKLLDYVNRQRPIVIDDVEQCTPYRGQSSIFALVDALGLRQGDKAQKYLHEVLQEDDPGYTFAMIVRQIRLILRAREMMDAGLPLDDEVHRSEFVVKKVASQARNFSLNDIVNIYHELLAIDLRAKNGQMDLDVALTGLVATLAS